MSGPGPERSGARSTPSAKRAAILAAGRALMLRHGIRKTRVEEVCADAGVSKRTFYAYFRDKEDLAVAVLSGIVAEGRARLEAVLAADRPLEDVIRQVLEVKADLAERTAAPFYRDALDDSTEAGRYALRERRSWEERIRQFYRDAQAHGRIRDDVDPDVLDAMIVRCRDLVVDGAVTSSAAEAVRAARTVTTVLLYGVVPR